ncbi:hypothetical protein K466DRAFT_597282 [Polyporus arcularius HHB13444]|uniref:MYND-type domain-containing protein n=1 Tax=Polyporus arcularius HHB13444 TaxID=1314778 RepID=A0A5C3PP61_9APHY|nr:hypothetical protein K466DRAFT_597282 [Polyporus arcularius HHB13444]
MYVCAQCDTDVTYCGPRHILQDWHRHAAVCEQTGVFTEEHALLMSLMDMARDARERQSVDSDDDSSGKNEVSTTVDRPMSKSTHTVVAWYAHPERSAFTPVYISVHPNRNADGTSGPSCTASVAEYVGRYPSRIVLRFGVRLHPRRTPLLILYPLNEYLRGQDVNQCITGLARRRQPEAKAWCGAVLVLKLAYSFVVEFADMQPTDRNDVVGYFAERR